MKKIVELLLMSIYITSINAQTSVRDSLKLLLQKEKEDTSRVLLLANLSSVFAESRPDTSMVLALEAISLARNIGFVKGEAMGLNMVAGTYNILGNYPKAMEVYLQALKINEKINSLDGVRRNYNNIGAVYYEQGDYRQALEYYFKSEDLAKKINNQRSISIVLVNIGESYYRLKIFDSARLFTQQAYDAAYGIQYSRIIGYSLSDMGDIHFETGQSSLALEYYRLSIPYSMNAENDIKISKTYYGMAKVFERAAQIDSALIYAKQAMAIAREKGFTKELLEASSFLSSYYKNSRNVDSAFFYMDVSKAANDSLFSRQQIKNFQSLSFDEKLRQEEIAAANLKATEERRTNLQYAAIAIGLITFIVLFLVLSRSIIVKEKFIKFFGILGLLAVFEFINLYIHPYLDRATDHSPLLMLTLLICIGALLVPLHYKLEKWITRIMVEKNKKKRLTAAKKTIAKLEGEQTN